MTVNVPIYKKREQDRGTESTAKNYWVAIKTYKKTLAHKPKYRWKSLLKPHFWAQHSGNVQWPLLNQKKKGILCTQDRLIQRVQQKKKKGLKR